MPSSQVSSQSLGILPRDVKTYILDQFVWFPLNRYFAIVYRDLIRKLEQCVASDDVSSVRRLGKRRMSHYATESRIRKYQSRIVMKTLFGYWSEEYGMRSIPFLVFKNIDFGRVNLRFYSALGAPMDSERILNFILQYHLPLFRMKDMLRLNLGYWHYRSGLMEETMVGVVDNIGEFNNVEECTELLQGRLYLPSIIQLRFGTMNVGSVALFQAVIRLNAMAGGPISPHIGPVGFESLTFENSSTRSVLPREAVDALIERHGHSLRHLNLNEYRVMDDGLKHILRHCANLVSLSLSCENLSNRELEEAFQIAPQFVHMKTLRLRYLQNDDADECLLYRTIVVRCPYLKNLHITNSFVSSASLREIADGGTTVHTLGMIHLASDLERSLSFMQSMKSLKRLEFYACTEWADGHSEMIGRNLCNIEVLTISFTSMTDEGALSILRNISHLRELHISLADNLTGEELFSEQNQLSCPSLQKLYLLLNSSLSTIGRNKHIQTMFPNLEELGLGNSRIRNDSVEQLLGLYSLKRLDISFCSFLTNKIDQYLRQLPHLTALVFQHSRLSSSQWRDLVPQLPNLQSLSGSVSDRRANFSIRNRHKAVSKLQYFLDSHDRIRNIGLSSHNF